MYMGHLSANEYFRKRFGGKVYKLALDGGMTCPNRDGTLDSRGCIFCSAGGSGDFACKTISEAKEALALYGKNTGSQFIAYFQSYTNTYAPVPYLRKIFSEAMDDPSIVGLSVGTRPDCLPEDVLDLLEELNRIKPVMVELGLQTSNEDTARLINRRWKLPAMERAAEELDRRGIEPIVHVILGLPGETEKEMIETVRYVNSLPVGGIKFQMLHVLEGTELAGFYRDMKMGNGKCPVTATKFFPDLKLDDYCSVLKSCLEVLRKDIVVHRITGDGPKSLLIAPKWSADKKYVLNTIKREIESI